MERVRACVGLMLVTAMAVGQTACSKDKEVEAVLSELDGFTRSLLDKVKSGTTPQAGVEQAQKYLEHDGGSLRSKLTGIKAVRGFQITEETKKKLESSFVSNVTAVASLQLEYAAQAAGDAEFRRRLEKLTADYRDLLLK